MTSYLSIQVTSRSYQLPPRFMLFQAWLLPTIPTQSIPIRWLKYVTVMAYPLQTHLPFSSAPAMVWLEPALMAPFSSLLYITLSHSFL